MREGLAQGRRADLGGGGLLRRLGGWSQGLALRRKGLRVASDARILGSGQFSERRLAEAARHEKETLRLSRRVIELIPLARKISAEAGVAERRLWSGSRRPATERARRLLCQVAVQGMGYSGGRGGAVPWGVDLGGQSTGRLGGPPRGPAIPQSALEPTSPIIQAETLNVHEGFALLQRIALPVQQGTRRVPGIRVQDGRSIRLLEALLHAGTAAGGWSSRQLHAQVLDRFRLRPTAYGLNCLRYDLRKLKGHGLVEREPGRYTYRITDKGQRVAVLFLLFHHRLCGPLAGSQFHHRPDPNHRPAHSKLEAAYYRADKAIDSVIAVLKAA